MSDSTVLVVAEVRAVRDADNFRKYQEGARGQIARFGGRVIGRGGRTTEGDAFGALLVQEWPSEAAFLAWQDSEDYRPLKTLRLAAADLRLAVIPRTPPA